MESPPEKKLCSLKSSLNSSMECEDENRGFENDNKGGSHRRYNTIIYDQKKCARIMPVRLPLNFERFLNDKPCDHRVYRLWFNDAATLKLRWRA